MYLALPSPWNIKSLLWPEKGLSHRELHTLRLYGPDTLEANPVPPTYLLFSWRAEPIKA